MCDSPAGHDDQVSSNEWQVTSPTRVQGKVCCGDEVQLSQSGQMGPGQEGNTEPVMSIRRLVCHAEVHTTVCEVATPEPSPLGMHQSVQPNASIGNFPGEVWVNAGWDQNNFIQMSGLYSVTQPCRYERVADILGHSAVLELGASGWAINALVASGEEYCLWFTPHDAVQLHEEGWVLPPASGWVAIHGCSKLSPTFSIPAPGDKSAPAGVLEEHTQIIAAWELRQARRRQLRTAHTGRCLLLPLLAAASHDPSWLPQASAGGAQFSRP